MKAVVLSQNSFSPLSLTHTHSLSLSLSLSHTHTLSLCFSLEQKCRCFHPTCFSFFFFPLFCFNLSFASFLASLSLLFSYWSLKRFNISHLGAEIGLIGIGWNCFLYIFFHSIAVEHHGGQLSATSARSQSRV